MWLAGKSSREKPWGRLVKEQDMLRMESSVDESKNVYNKQFLTLISLWADVYFFADSFLAQSRHFSSWWVQKRSKNIMSRKSSFVNRRGAGALNSVWVSSRVTPGPVHTLYSIILLLYLLLIYLFTWSADISQSGTSLEALFRKHTGLCVW